MTTSTTVFAAAVISTAQFGNSFDTRGYREHQPITVVGSKKFSPLGSELFLIVDRNEQMLGIATKVDQPDTDEPVKGQYYCTNARRLSDAWSVQRSLDSLGFGDVDVDFVYPYL